MKRTKKICITAVFLALSIVFSSFSIPVPGGHLYLNDLIIVIASLILDPLYAFIVGGVGAFLGDFFFYPTPMFVSLITHGLQAIVISLFCRNVLKSKPFLSAVIASIIGAIIMVAGYTFGRAFIYANVETALIKLPFQILQALVGVILAPIIVHKFKLGVKSRE